MGLSDEGVNHISASGVGTAGGDHQSQIVRHQGEDGTAAVIMRIVDATLRCKAMLYSRSRSSALFAALRGPASLMLLESAFMLRLSELQAAKSAHVEACGQLMARLDPVTVALPCPAAAECVLTGLGRSYGR